ncbi:unnamed protein product [Linum tenue]|uniref:GDSL esterase/lipase n=1 Tax=Linum tenue TaxID=586396 RepID=A0AAV0IC78_9ROSI|nr:unnamed protein product [Linum tenue]
MTTARADSPPNGIDYPHQQPTGRFSNGLNFPDLIAEALGLESPLPFLNPDLKGKKLLAGANFASAGIGVLNDTGFQFVTVLKMYEQLGMFLEYKHRLAALMGPAKAQEVVSNAVILITCGGNDFVNNYFLTPVAPRREQYTLPDFCGYVMSEYKKHLLALYGLNRDIGEDVFISANAFSLKMDMIEKPEQYGAHRTCVLVLPFLIFMVLLNLINYGCRF